MIRRHAIFRGSVIVAAVFAAGACAAIKPGAPEGDPTVLDPAKFQHYVDRFNTMEDENRANFVPNAGAWDWLRGNIPFFECPDAEVEEIYYYRWWALRKHLRRIDNGFVFTEFLTKERPISSALGHHLREGRWLHDQRYHDDYVCYWLRGAGGKPQPTLHKYSSWLPEALYERWLVTQDTAALTGLLDDLVADFRQWETEKKLPSGLFWQFDVRDAMEESISGSRTKKNIRPTINSYMFGSARAIAAIARLAGRADLAQEFDGTAAGLKRLTQEVLWDPAAQFFKVRLEEGGLSDAREEIGFIPWYFHLPEPGRGFEAAWAQFTDPQGFRAPFGITTAERRHPKFRSHGTGTCEWDGAVWPFATSQTLVALANVLRDYPPQSFVSARDWFDAFRTYVRSQHDDGKPYIGEYLDEKDGHWLMGKNERSRYYNHSTFADLVITGVAGLCPRPDDLVEVRPLLPGGTWDWFCLDGVRYHGRTLTILWDRDGSRYGRGAGFQVLVDHAVLARSDALQPLTARLPPP
jgi:hypothetical protein